MEASLSTSDRGLTTELKILNKTRGLWPLATMMSDKKAALAIWTDFWYAVRLRHRMSKETWSLSFFHPLSARRQARRHRRRRSHTLLQEVHVMGNTLKYTLWKIHDSLMRETTSVYLNAIIFSHILQLITPHVGLNTEIYQISLQTSFKRSF